MTRSRSRCRTGTARRVSSPVATSSCTPSRTRARDLMQGRGAGSHRAPRSCPARLLDSPEDSEDILRAFDFEQLECDDCAAHLTAVRPERHGDFADGPCRAQPLEQCRVFIGPIAPEPERVDLLREELGRSAEAEQFDEPRIRVDERAGARIEDADRGAARLEDLAVADVRFLRATLLLTPFGDILEQESDAEIGRASCRE